MLRHPQQLCLWSRRGFASPQSALSSYCNFLLFYQTNLTDCIICSVTNNFKLHLSREMELIKCQFGQLAVYAIASAMSSVKQWWLFMNLVKKCKQKKKLMLSCGLSTLNGLQPHEKCLVFCIMDNMKCCFS